MSTDTPISTYTLTLQIFPGTEATVVHCKGRLTLETASLLKTEVKALLPVNQRVVLDLTDLSYMDSAGLGLLVALYISAKTNKCEFGLVNLSPRIRQLVGITNLLGVFESAGRFGTRLP